MDTQRAILLNLMTRPMQLSELAAATGASMPTLRRAVRELEDDDWIRIVGRADDTGGRPAQIFGVDDRSQTVVGVHLAHPGMHLVATDLSGGVVARHVPLDVWDLQPEDVYAEVSTFVRAVREEHRSRRIIGIGVATPGYVDAATGSVIAIGRVPGWNNVPLRDRLREAAKLPVTIGNDMDALATAEIGLGSDARTYVYVGFGEGVKFTMFLQGAPYLGPFANAGLVGPDLLAEGGGREAAKLLGLGGLIGAYARRSGDASAAAARSPAELMEAFGRILERSAHDAAAEGVVHDMTRVLAAQIAYVVHLVQPELVVIGGELAGAPNHVLDWIEAETRSRLPSLLDNHLLVRRAQVVGEDATAAGAAGVVLRRFLTEDTAPIGRLAR